MQLSTQDSISSAHFGNVPAIPLIHQYGLRHPLAAPSLHSLPTSVYLTLAHPSLQLKNISHQGLSTHWCRQAVASLLSSLGSIRWWPCRATSQLFNPAPPSTYQNLRWHFYHLFPSWLACSLCLLPPRK